MTAHQNLPALPALPILPCHTLSASFTHASSH
jgi:hypothetical protein